MLKLKTIEIWAQNWMLSPTTIAVSLAWQHISNESLSLTIFDSMEVNAFAVEVKPANCCL
jgi:hypothetical protein